MSLESFSPSTPLEHSRALWHGSVTDGVPTGLRTRWVDKPVQFIVYDNGVAGLMGEHKETEHDLKDGKTAAPGEVGDGWGKLLVSLEDFPYEAYKINV